MKPLSEKEIREKVKRIDSIRALKKLLIDDSNISYGNRTQHIDYLIDDIVSLILSDRKAWGEYVIGEDEKYPCVDGGVSRNHLRTKQRQRNDSFAQQIMDKNQEIREAHQELRQRNQGEKTDE